MRTLLIDDERLARQELRRLLSVHPDVEIIGEAANIVEAQQAIERTTPDLLLLDVRMPGGTGFELLEQLDTAPAVIFTTAYDEYAVRAFEVNALDYLVKPVIADRLSVALEKVRGLLAASQKPLTQVFLREGERCWLVRTADIALVESEGNYSRVYFPGAKPLIFRSLASLEARLDPVMFFRASRKHIVNLTHIASIELDVAGNYGVKLREGQLVELSRRQSARLREMLSL